MNIDFSHGLYPAAAGSGFRMEGYYVWCGSAIRGDDGRYYLFASRWPESTAFPDGYMTHSEIVLASTPSLAEPFTFEKVILSGRGGGFWDGQMAHNPQLVKFGGEYLLFYIGTPDGSYEKRKIGVAHSRSLRDGWVRPDVPLSLPPNANNPAAVVMDDGTVYLAFRDGRLQVSIAKAGRYDGPYEVIASNIFPKGKVEDMFMFRSRNRFEIIAEDNTGAYTGLIGAGVHFVSEDAIAWRSCEPMQVYSRTVHYTDGRTAVLQRRERPQLLVDGKRLYLFTTAKLGGETREEGGTTWNMVQEYKTE